MCKRVTSITKKLMLKKYKKQICQDSQHQHVVVGLTRVGTGNCMQTFLGSVIITL